MSPCDPEVQLGDLAVLVRSVDSVLLLEYVKRGSGFFRNVSVNTCPAKRSSVRNLGSRVLKGRTPDHSASLILANATASVPSVKQEPDTKKLRCHRHLGKSPNAEYARQRQCGVVCRGYDCSSVRL